MTEKGDIQWLSALSRIRFDERELLEMQRDMESIIALMDSLKAVDLPADEAAVDTLTLADLRDEEICASLPVPLLLSQSRDAQDGYFAIPKVFE